MKHFLVLTMLFLSVAARGQQSAYNEYISTYTAMAIDQMRRHNIPASITLAQGLLESGAGKSRLAREANNHFGIKVGVNWNGPYIVQSDDRPNDRFRVYGSVQESYEDHSKFLKQKRYQPLFSLSPTDYKGWAYGLKRCGYATSPTYAESLISIVERYELFSYDNGAIAPAASTATSQPVRLASRNSLALQSMGIGRCNDNYYVTVEPGESLASIAARTNVSPSRLVKYNELTEGYVLTVGDRIYLKAKRNKASKELKGHVHTVKEGESMHSISQIYGIRFRTLYRVNHLPADYVPRPGDQLRIR